MDERLLNYSFIAPLIIIADRLCIEAEGR